METTTILGLIIIWIIIGAIVGSFGKSRTIGFAGSFFASVLLSPILAMLFILASDKTARRNLTSGEKSLFIIPIIICLLIPLGIRANDNLYSHSYEIQKAEQQIEFLSGLTQDDFEGGEYQGRYDNYSEMFGYVNINGKAFKPYKLNYYRVSKNGYAYMNYDDLTWNSINEINKFRTAEIARLKEIINQNTNLGLMAFFQ